MDPYALLIRTCKGRVLRNEPLSSHTSFGIGGPADCFLWAEDAEDVEAAMDAVSSEGLPFLAIGNGTNLLVDDGGVRGVVVRLGRGFGGLKREETRVRVGAGVDLAKLLDFCASHGLSGLEFAAGVPGTLGGALYTDAGTTSGRVRDRLLQVTAVGQDKETSTIDGPSFRHEDEDPLAEGSIITEASFQLTPATEETVRREMDRLLTRRRETQPIGEPSAGCIFRNPKGQPAGRLIDQCGCKGMRVGGAIVSEKHANFIINTGGAQSKDVLELIERIRARVHQATGVTLSLEINVIGPWGGQPPRDQVTKERHEY